MIEQVVAEIAPAVSASQETVAVTAEIIVDKLLILLLFAVQLAHEITGEILEELVGMDVAIETRFGHERVIVQMIILAEYVRTDERYDKNGRRVERESQSVLEQRLGLLFLDAGRRVRLSRHYI